MSSEILDDRVALGNGKLQRLDREMDELKVLVGIEELSKDFPGVQALAGVSFKIEKGEVHGLVGENGAGKSTLGNILAGKYRDYAGRIFFDGREVRIISPQVAIGLGICEVFQDTNLIPGLNVASNLYLAKEPVIKAFPLLVDKRKIISDAKQILIDELKVNIDLYKLARELSVSEQQIVSIAKGLTANADLFILDESTSSLSKSETDRLFTIVRRLKSHGKTILFISHKLEEVFEITDRITVLRDGRYVFTEKTRNLPHQELINAMAGRKVETRYPKIESYHDETLLSVRNLSRRKEFSLISFDLHKGEVLGFAGLVGAGRTNVVKTIFGATSKTEGEICIEGKKIEIKSPRMAIRIGMGLLTEDRRNESLIIKLDVIKNIIISNLKKVQRAGFVRKKLAKTYTDVYIENLKIKTSSPLQRVEFLSGGNQQKVVLSKWLFADIKILILDEPTKGIDIGTKYEIYGIIKRLAENGLGIILISSEIKELLGLCHTIIVMKEGRQVKALKNDENLTQEDILRYAITDDRNSDVN